MRAEGIPLDKPRQPWYNMLAFRIGIAIEARSAEMLTRVFSYPLVSPAPPAIIRMVSPGTLLSPRPALLERGFFILCVGPSPPIMLKPVALYVLNLGVNLLGNDDID